MKLLFNKQEFIAATTKLSLDELYEIAEELGEVEIGGYNRHRAMIKAHFTKDLLALRSSNSSCVKKNLAEVIDKARKLKEIYQNEGWD